MFCGVLIWCNSLVVGCRPLVGVVRQYGALVWCMRVAYHYGVFVRLLVVGCWCLVVCRVLYGVLVCCFSVVY